MELNEKLLELRKQKGLTQEELAEILYVSRTAVSKWESGRGYPNIESLKAISKFFSVSIDELLSGEQVLRMAEEEQKQKENRLHDLVFGLLDVSLAMLLFLPLFGQRTEGGVLEVSLLALSGVSAYLRLAYFGVVLGSVFLGICTLALQNCTWNFWTKNKRIFSFLCNGLAVLLFVSSLQAYGAILLLIFLMIKVLMANKK